ncbi:MAG: D-alanyl-D-alanine carboxypeptidase/D-alanyl-D-alanine-endopeptidase [Prolixibacteraceae bacterium]|nr:D-alanyl-D-alanine carboxypeptidase/D-alanyl-D-alanine-endopeptidase [Prolixibacteraceae bacterium]
MKRILYLVVIFLSTITWGQPATEIILKNFLADDALAHTPVSISVVDVNTGEPLLETNPHFCLVPASVQKLLTSAAALEILGGYFRFETTLWASGEIENGKLTGNLIISGGGDPALGSGYFHIESEKKRFLAKWASMIRDAGIDTIDGDIVASTHYFTDCNVPPSWLWEDLGNYFGAAASGINVFDNTFEIVFTTPLEHGKPAVITNIEPEIPVLHLVNKVVSSPEQKDGTTIFGNPHTLYRKIKGTLPAGSPAYKVKASVPDPALLLAYEFKKALTRTRVVVEGDARSIGNVNNHEAETLLVSWPSPPLTEIIEKMNHESLNLYAEVLLKQIALTQKGEGTTEKGTEALTEFWNSKNINGCLKLADGSGLSRQNTLTSQTITDVLGYMKNNSPWYDAFYKSVPLTGMEGTQKYYFQDSFLKGKLRAKSGSMTGIRSFAGYMTTKSGTELAFCLIVNNFECGSFQMAYKLEKLIEEIYRIY